MPVTAPAGSAAVTAATSARIAAAVPALRNRYSICAAAGVPGARSAAISAGRTQPSAESVTDVAMPTTVSVGLPGRAGHGELGAERQPSGSRRPESPDSTICPGRVRPVAGVQREIVDRAARRGAPRQGQRRQGDAGAPGADLVGVTVTSANGPAAAVTSGSRRGRGQLRRR